MTVSVLIHSGELGSALLVKISLSRGNGRSVRVLAILGVKDRSYVIAHRLQRENSSDGLSRESQSFCLQETNAS